MSLSGCVHLGNLLIYFCIEESPRELNVFFKSMINETLIINFVEEQEDLSLSIWTHQELERRRRQGKGKGVTDCVVEEDDLGVDVKAGEESGRTANENDRKKLFGIHNIVTQQEAFDNAMRALL